MSEQGQQPLSFKDAFNAGLDGPATPAGGSTTAAGKPSALVIPQNPEAPAPIEPGAAQPDQGFFGKAWDVTKGIAAGLLRAPGEAVGGALDTARDVNNALQKPVGEAIKHTFGDGGFGDYLITQSMGHKADMADILSARSTLGQVGNSTANQATANLAAIGLTAAIAPEMDLAEAGTGWKMLQGAGKFGAASAVVGDPQAERFSNALQSLGVDTQFTDWLGAKSPDDTNQMEDRFKSAVDNTIGGLAGEAVFRVAKMAYLGAKGMLTTSAIDDAGNAAKEIIPEAAQPADVQTQTVSGRASPSGETTETGAPANAAGGEADSSKITFQVKPKGSSQDSWRSIGEMDKDDYRRFLAEAEKYTGQSPKSLDVTEANAPELFQGIGQTKISTLGSPDDVAPYYRALLDGMPKIDRPMSDADLKDQVAKAAVAMGLDRNATMAFVKNFAVEASKLPQAVGIARAGWASLVQAVSHNAARGVDNLSPEELKYALDTVLTSRAYGAHILDIKAGMGRGLRAWQLPAFNAESYFQQFGSEEAFKSGSGILPEGADAAGMLPPLPRNLKELDNFYKLWAAAGTDDASRANLLQGKNVLPAPGWYVRNALANFYTGSLLAGKAIVKGFVMPAFMGALETMERTAGAGLMAVNPMMDAETRQAAAAIAKATPQAYFQTMGDFAAAFRYSIESLKNGGQSIIGAGYSAFNQNGITKVSRLGPVTQEILDAAGKPGDLRYPIGNAINMWPRAVFSLVGGHDELTKRLAYLGRVRMQSLSYGLRNGISGQDLEDFVRGSIQDAVDPSTKAATYSDVLNEAARTTFLNKPDGAGASTIRFLNQSRNAVPELRYILPVLDVPASGLGEMLRRIPIVSAAFQGTRDDLLGAHGDIAQAQAYGRWMTGATLLGTGLSLSRANILTGGGPDNPADKANWMNNGYQPYSINIPHIGWVSYKDWEPIGGILGIIGTLNDHTVHYAEDDQIHDKYTGAVAALAEYAKDKSAMKGVADILNFGDPDSSEATWLHFIKGVTAGEVPAFVHDIRNFTDPNLRDTKSDWYDQFLNAIPGASNKLPPLRNVYGEPIHHPNDGSNLYGLLPMTIASARQEGKDPVTDELDKVYQLTGYAPGVTHPQELSHGTFDPHGMILENGRTMFDQFAANRMEANPILDDQNTKGALAALFHTDEYKEAKYGSPAKAADYMGDASKLAMIRNVFDAANTYSKVKLAQDSPIAKRYLAVGDAKADSPDLLRTYKADDLAQNPSILKALGIDIEDYESKVSGQ